jgi:hypothetical protein
MIVSPYPVLKKKRNRTLTVLIFLVLCFDLLLRAFSYSSPNSDLSSQGDILRSSSLYFNDFFKNKPIYMIGDGAAFESFSLETLGYSLKLNKLLYPHNEVLNRGATGLNCIMWATQSVELLMNLRNAGLVIINLGTE